jgi:PAS domain S-box-containing protein
MNTPIVLIVDDDADLRELLIRSHGQDACTFIEATNGAAALAICQRQRPDFIFLDIMMPVMDGITACAKIRALPGFEYVPILMITALDEASSITRAFAAGATDYITRPFNPVVLSQRVRHLLRSVQAEDQLRANERKFRSFVEQASDGFVLIDEAGHIIDWNRAMEQMTGYARAELLGRSVDELQALLQTDESPLPLAVHHRVGELQDEPYGERADNDERYHAIELHHRDGSRRVVQVVDFAIQIDHDRRLGSTWRDVTERQQMESALRESEARHRLITDNMTDVVWLLDLQLRTLYTSPAIERRLGYSLEEIKQLAASRRLLTPRSEEVILDFFSKEFVPARLGQPDYRISQTLDLECYRRDGVTTWYEVTITLVRDDHGRPTGILGVGRDIAERKRAEKEILQLNADLARRARELAALIAAGRALASSLELSQVLDTVVGESQYLLDAERSTVLLQDPLGDDLIFAAVVGEGSDVLIGTRVPKGMGLAGWVAREGRPVLVQEAEKDPRFWPEADARTGYVSRSVLAVPIEFHDIILGVVEAINPYGRAFTERDREILEALAVSAAIAIENARLYQAEREQTRRLQESQARLVHAEKMSALGRLVASLTHEINNPLQAVQSGLYLIEEVLDDDARQADIRHDLQIISGEVTRISNLMRRLREFSRPVQLEAQPTDLHALLTNILELVGKQMEHLSIKVMTHWDERLPDMLVNPDQLTQVFMNLVLNAIDAMPDGGLLALTTMVDRTAPAAPIVRVEVADQGEGISPESQQHIFEPFFTTKSHGTGLGLAISYEIIKSLGGEITVTNRPDRGATFTVVLPFREALPASTSARYVEELP